MSEGTVLCTTTALSSFRFYNYATIPGRILGLFRQPTERRSSNLFTAQRSDNGPPPYSEAITTYVLLISAETYSRLWRILEPVLPKKLTVIPVSTSRIQDLQPILNSSTDYPRQIQTDKPGSDSDGGMAEHAPNPQTSSTNDPSPHATQLPQPLATRCSNQSASLAHSLLPNST